MEVYYINGKQHTYCLLRKCLSPTHLKPRWEKKSFSGLSATLPMTKRWWCWTRHHWQTSPLTGEASFNIAINSQSISIVFFCNQPMTSLQLPLNSPPLCNIEISLQRLRVHGWDNHTSSACVQPVSSSNQFARKLNALFTCLIWMNDFYFIIINIDLFCLHYDEVSMTSVPHSGRAEDLGS